MEFDCGTKRAPICSSDLLEVSRRQEIMFRHSSQMDRTYDYI
jgi:hypothetical protein